MRTVDSGQHFRVALLQVCAAVGLTEDTELALDAAQLVGTTAVETEALV